MLNIQKQKKIKQEKKCNTTLNTTQTKATLCMFDITVILIYPP